MQIRYFWTAAAAFATIAFSCGAAQAAWTHGSYSVNRVITQIGNYVYAATAGGGDVGATRNSSGSSSIEVEFSVTFSANMGDPDLYLVGRGTLTGDGSGANYSGGAGVEAQTAGINHQTFQSPNALNYNATLNGEPGQAAPGPVTETIVGSASAGVMGNSSSCWAHSTVWYAF